MELFLWGSDIARLISWVGTIKLLTVLIECLTVKMLSLVEKYAT